MSGDVRIFGHVWLFVVLNARHMTGSGQVMCSVQRLCSLAFTLAALACAAHAHAQDEDEYDEDNPLARWESADPNSHVAPEIRTLLDATAHYKMLRTMALEEDFVQDPIDGLVPFETLFAPVEDGVRDAYAFTRDRPENRYEYAMQDLDPELVFVEELRCVARHAAYVRSLGVPLDGGLLLSRAAHLCGWIAPNQLSFFSFESPTEGRESCRDLSERNSSLQPECVQIRLLKNATRQWRHSPRRAAGSGQYVAGASTWTVIVTTGVVLKIRPVNRILDTRDRPLTMRLRRADSDTTLFGVFTSVDDRSEQLCRRIHREDRTRWSCDAGSVDHDLGMGFHVDDNSEESDWYPIYSLQAFRTPPPAVPARVAACEEWTVGREVTVDDVHGWVNQLRQQQGLLPLRRAPLMDEWITLLAHDRASSYSPWRWLGTGFAVDAPLAEYDTDWLTLHSDEPCREWHAALDYDPALRTHLMSPDATLLAVSTIVSPTGEPHPEILTFVGEEDSPLRRERIRERVQAEIAEHFPETMRGFEGPRAGTRQILEDYRALVESDGGEPAVQLPLMNETMEQLWEPGRPYIFLYPDRQSNPWSVNVARRNILPGMGLEFEVVRISSTTSNTVGYHVIYGVFR